MDGTRMTFSPERCVIAGPCSSPPEQGLPPCPSRLGTAQRRETEAHLSCRNPRGPKSLLRALLDAEHPVCHAWGSTEPSLPPSQTLHILQCPRPGTALASPSPGITQPWHCSIVAQPCPLLPTRLSESSNSSCPEKKNNFEEGKGERRKPSGLAPGPGAPAAQHRRHTQHPLSPAFPVSPVPSGPGGRAPTPAHKGAGLEQWSLPPLPPCRPLPPPAPTVRAGTGARPLLPHGSPVLVQKSLRGTRGPPRQRVPNRLFSPNFGSPSPDTPQKHARSCLAGRGAQ